MPNIIKLHTEFTFDSAHKLEGYKGKCASTHGHTWKMELDIFGDKKFKDKVGILIDFGIVKKLKEELDHKYLNDVIKMNPTAENLSEWIYNRLKYKIKNKQIDIHIRLYETAVGKETYCDYGDF